MVDRRFDRYHFRNALSSLVILKACVFADEVCVAQHPEVVIIFKTFSQQSLSCAHPINLEKFDIISGMHSCE